MNLRRTLAAIVVCLCAAGAARAEPPSSRMLVMPFDNVTHESRIVWMGEAAAVLLTDNVAQRGFSAVTREERRAAFDRLQLPPAATLTDATVMRIGRLVGASVVVVGSVRLEGESLIVHARALTLDTARLRDDVVEMGPLTEVFEIFERVTGRITAQGSEPGGARPQERPSIGAFEPYVKGLMARAPATAIKYLTQSLKVQPGFDRARLALWDVYAEEDAHDRALAAVQPVSATSPYYRRARFLAGVSQLNLKRYEAAFATFTALTTAEPDAAVLNNLGVAQLHRAAVAPAARASVFFAKAADADAGDADYFFNLGYALWLERNPQAAVAPLREAVRRDPTDGDTHFLLGSALSASANAVEGTREKELAHRLSSTYVEWEKRPGPDVIPKGIERIKSGVPALRPAGAVPRDTAGQPEPAQASLDRARRLYEQERDGEALAELDRALFLSPYLAPAQLLVGRIHLRGGHAAAAVDALKIAIWSAESAEAHVALGEAYLALRDPASARAEGDRALVLDPASKAARELIQKITD